MQFMYECAYISHKCAQYILVKVTIGLIDSSALRLVTNLCFTLYVACLRYTNAAEN